jgi:hypothetical protein
MSISRRKFTKITLLGGAAFATSSSIFFPKPAESLSLDFLIKDAKIRNVWEGLIAYAGVKLIDTIFSPSQSMRETISVAENNFSQQGFSNDKTPLGRIRDDSIIWGQERRAVDPFTQSSIPNPGITIVEENNPEPTQFTASTTVGIQTAMKVLKEQYKLSLGDVKDILMPTQEIFEDITTWHGDNDPTIGKNPHVGFTNYRSRVAEVTRRYDRVNPKLGRIQMSIDSPQFNGSIITNIKFT